MFKRPCEGRVTSPFGWRRHPVTGARQSFHQGIDIAKPGNVSVYAAASGTVTRVGALGTYGNVVMIVHNINGRTYETNYAHLHSYAVRVGQKVAKGQRIARMGNTGRSTGQHLHFEIHTGRWKTGQPNAVDPAIYINFYDVPQRGAVGPAVKELQRKLNQLGYNLLVDGSFGPAMDNALKDFQQKNKLAVDGKAGPATMKVIDSKLREKPEPSKPKEEKKMYSPTSAALRKEVIEVVKSAVKDGTLTSDVWLKKLEKGDISNSDLMSLNFIISERRRGQYTPSTATLRKSLPNFIKGAIEDNTLTSDEWLKKANDGTLSDADIISLHLEVNARRSVRTREAIEAMNALESEEKE